MAQKGKITIDSEDEIRQIEEELEEDDNSQFLIEGQPFNLTGYDWGG